MEKGISTNKIERKHRSLRNIITGITASLLILTGCKIATPTPSQVGTINPDISASIVMLKTKPYSISPELLTRLSTKDLENIDKAYSLQLEEFGCNTKIEFVSKDLKYKTREEDNLIVKIPEEAVSGRISLDMNLIDKIYQPRDLKFYSFILHALQHACDPIEITRPKEKMILPNGYEVIGFQGLNVIQRNPKGIIEGFGLFEEASAEYKSLRAEPNDYLPLTYRYQDLVSFFNSLMITYADLDSVKNWDNTSDVMGFISKIRGKLNPDAKDLYYVMKAFTDVNNGVPMVPILQDIFEERGVQK